MSKVVEIPFSKVMVKAVLEGRKVCTSRGEVKGDLGDTFMIGDMEFRIVDIQRHRLISVTSILFRQEGTNSPEEFEELWKSLHRGHYDGKKAVFVHYFARVSGVD